LLAVEMNEENEMSNLSINVEVLAGTSIEKAIVEAKDLAQRMELAFVKFNFNGVHMSVSRSADVEGMSWRYGKALVRERVEDKRVIG
jgi:hypothetical protein